MSGMMAMADRGKVKIAIFSEAGKLTGVEEVPKVVKSEAEWKAELPEPVYLVMRKKGTERAFTGRYYKSHEDGLYKCASCWTVLFDSKAKFESGTGWPSFYEPVHRLNVKVESDLSMGMSRDEVVCARCHGHLGHVFPDGPPPTGMRYCMNSASLVFVGRATASRE